ncbi:Rrf2 family transcriptional regulator [Flavobacterium sp. JP2137]|uniref:Rrf2 family transcriptional regulator n=1 Tax=Flavobacterium sp. JP2137 TaxID=3414510 RepID=UPI003D2FE70E
MNNIRFATVLHILTLLRMKEGQLLSSEYIAGSVNVNAAAIRKEIKNLKTFGFITSKEGKGGGYALGRSAKKIHLSELYKAVSEVHLLGKSHNPNPECPVGKDINTHLKNLFETVDKAFLKEINQITLEDFSKKFF